MSDQQGTGIGVVLDLEELFLSRGFGRRPARVVSTAPATVVSEPAWLEQVFLSDAFGHPELVMDPGFAEGPAPGVAGRPALVLLRGGGEGGPARGDITQPHHRALAAVSGVAAAALAVAALASGTGQGPGRAPAPGTEQAQGAAPGRGVPGSVGGSRTNPVGPTVLPSAPTIGTSGVSGGGGTNATLTAFSPPVASVVPPGTTAGATPPAAPTQPGAGPSPGPPAGGGGGGGTSVLTPALNVVGNEVTSVGSSVTSTAGDVSQALPVASAIQGVGAVATAAVDNLGGGTPPTILAGSLQQ